MTGCDHAGQIVANLLIAPLDDAGNVTIRCSVNRAQVIIDRIGSFSDRTGSPWANNPKTVVSNPTAVPNLVDGVYRSVCILPEVYGLSHVEEAHP